MEKLSQLSKAKSIDKVKGTSRDGTPCITFRSKDWKSIHCWGVKACQARFLFSSMKNSVNTWLICFSNRIFVFIFIFIGAVGRFLRGGAKVCALVVEKVKDSRCRNRCRALDAVEPSGKWILHVKLKNLRSWTWTQWGSEQYHRVWLSNGFI